MAGVRSSHGGGHRGMHRPPEQLVLVAQNDPDEQVAELVQEGKLTQELVSSAQLCPPSVVVTQTQVARPPQTS